MFCRVAALSIFITLVWRSSPVIAQHQEILDSLYAELPSARDTVKVKVLYAIGRYEFDREPSLGIAFAQKSLVLAKQIGYQDGIVKAYKQIGFFLSNHQADYESGKRYLDSALALASTRPQRITVDIAAAIVYQLMGEFETSHAFLMEALELAGPLETRQHFLIYNGIAYNLSHLKRFREGTAYFKKALILAKKIGNTRDIGSALSNLGLSYSNENKNDSALLIYKQLYQFELKYGNPLGNPGLLSELGKLYYEADRKDSAYYFMHRGRRAARENGIQSAMRSTVATLARYHLDNYPDSALYYGRLLRQLTNPASVTESEETNLMLANAHGRLKHFDSAYYFHQRFLVYHDSVFQENQTRQIAEMEAAYQLREKQRAIDQLRSKTENEILKRNMFAAAFVLVIVIAGLIVFILRARIRAKKKELAAKNWQLENFTRSMVEKSELVEEMRAQIDHLKSEFREPRERIENLSEILNSSILTDVDWEKFKILFEQVHHSFFAELKLKHPGLTQAEIRLAALVKLNISTREMANMLGISPDSANKARYRLRKKLELNPEQDLKSFIENVSETEIKA